MKRHYNQYICSSSSSSSNSVQTQSMWVYSAMWVFSHIGNDGIVVHEAYFSSTKKNLTHAGMAYTILEIIKK